ncbi:hypothetical protein F4861DRAFT_505642 [Xylaria intraflava]|nr:hypothetical protein F4861DRAFT_505642 [Xylaria intraflava]
MSLSDLHLLPEMVQQAILNGPALKPPPGVTPTFDNPPNQNALGMAVTTLCLSVSTIAIVIVLYARFLRFKKVRYEDFFVLSGYAITVSIIYFYYDITLGVGVYVHQWDVRVKDLNRITYPIHAASILYGASIMLLKISILLQWLRIFVPRGTVKGFFYWISHALIWINALLYTSTMISVFASCKPFSRLWDKTVPGVCNVNRDLVDLISAAANLASDIIILILPQRAIWKLHIQTRKKILTTFVFFWGIFAVVAAAFRVDASYRYLKSEDKTYRVVSVGLWGLGELTSAILVYSIPSFPKVFREWKRSFSVLVKSMPWAKYATEKTGSTNSSWPGFEKKRLAAKTPYDEEHDGRALRGPYASIGSRSFELDPVMPMTQDTETAIVRTTEIVVVREDHSPTRGAME